MERENNDDDDKNDSLYIPEDEIVKDTNKDAVTSYRERFSSTSTIRNTSIQRFAQKLQAAPKLSIFRNKGEREIVIEIIAILRSRDEAELLHQALNCVDELVAKEGTR